MSTPIIFAYRHYIIYLPVIQVYPIFSSKCLHITSICKYNNTVSKFSKNWVKQKKSFIFMIFSDNWLKIIDEFYLFRILMKEFYYFMPISIKPNSSIPISIKLKTDYPLKIGWWKITAKKCWKQIVFPAKIKFSGKKRTPNSPCVQRLILANESVYVFFQSSHKRRTRCSNSAAEIDARAASNAA
mgnify:CR=1 FL=1